MTVLLLVTARHSGKFLDFILHPITGVNHIPKMMKNVVLFLALCCTVFRHMLVFLDFVSFLFMQTFFFSLTIVQSAAVSCLDAIYIFKRSNIIAKKVM